MNQCTNNIPPPPSPPPPEEGYNVRQNEEIQVLDPKDSDNRIHVLEESSKRRLERDQLIHTSNSESHNNNRKLPMSSMQKHPQNISPPIDYDSGKIIQKYTGMTNIMIENVYNLRLPPPAAAAGGYNVGQQGMFTNRPPPVEGYNLWQGEGQRGLLTNQPRPAAAGYNIVGQQGMFTNRPPPVEGYNLWQGEGQRGLLTNLPSPSAGYMVQQQQGQGQRGLLTNLPSPSAGYKVRQQGLCTNLPSPPADYMVQQQQQRQQGQRGLLTNLPLPPATYWNFSNWPSEFNHINAMIQRVARPALVQQFGPTPSEEKIYTQDQDLATIPTICNNIPSPPPPPPPKEEIQVLDPKDSSKKRKLPMSSNQNPRQKTRNYDQSPKVTIKVSKENIKEVVQQLTGMKQSNDQPPTDNHENDNNLRPPQPPPQEEGQQRLFTDVPPPQPPATNRPPHFQRK